MHLRWTTFGMFVLVASLLTGCGSSSQTQPNATPIITNLAPSSITAGSQTFTLFISGTGFINSSAGVTTAYWNGSPRTGIVNVNNNQIALTVLASDVAAPGIAQITASNPAPGGGLSQNSATFNIDPVMPATPLISSVSPDSASPGGKAFTLTVNGSNFMAPTGTPDPSKPQLAGSQIAWNGSPRFPSAFVSATQLTTTITVDDIATAGCDSVSVYTPNGAGGFIFSPSVTFSVSGSNVPLICGISPSTGVQGGPAFTMSVFGAGFTASSMVQWNGSARPTTLINAGELQAQIPATDLAKAGTFPITVANSSSKSGTSVAVNFVVSAAAPTVSSVSPSTAVAGGPAFALTVTGTNYTQDTVVEWNGSPRATKFSSTTSLTAQILASDIATAGSDSIVVVNPQGAGGASAAFPFIVTSAAAAIAAKFPQVVSVNATGGPANGASESPAISADGRYVAFYSEAKNLVASGASGNVFVRDTCAGVAAACTPSTRAIDVSADGSAANGKTGRQLAISGDGRFVAFVSRATNLVSVVTQAASGYWSVYVRDLCVGANVPSGCAPHTDLLSVSANGESANGPSASPSLSGDGRFAAFVSSAANISIEVNLAHPQVFVRDTCAGPTATRSCVPRTSSVAMDEDFVAAKTQTGRPVISADGRFVAYEAWTAPAAAQTQPTSAATSATIVLADTCLGIDAPAGCSPSAEKISYGVDGSSLPGVNLAPSINQDARFVVFESQAASGTGSAATASKVFLRDTCLGATAPDGCVPSTMAVAGVAFGSSDKNQAYSPFISANGRYISLVEGRSSFAVPSESSTEGALVVRDTCFTAMLPCNPHTYAFSAAAMAGATNGATTTAMNAVKAAVVTVSGGTKIPSVSVDEYSAAPISADGRYAAFYAPATAAAQPASGVGDVYISVALF